MSDKLYVVICLTIILIGCLVTIIIIKPKNLRFRARFKSAEIVLELEDNLHDNNKKTNAATLVLKKIKSILNV